MPSLGLRSVRGLKVGESMKHVDRGVFFVGFSILSIAGAGAGLLERVASLEVVIEKQADAIAKLSAKVAVLDTDGQNTREVIGKQSEHVGLLLGGVECLLHASAALWAEAGGKENSRGWLRRANDALKLGRLSILQVDGSGEWR